MSESVKEVNKRVILFLVMLIIISATAGSCSRRSYSGYHGANRVRSLPHKKWKQPKSRYKEPKKNYSMNQDVLWIESYDRAVSHSSPSSSSRLDPRLAVGSQQLAVNEYQVLLVLPVVIIGKDLHDRAGRDFVVSLLSLQDLLP